MKKERRKMFKSWVELSQAGVEWRAMEYEEVKLRWVK